MLIQTLEKRELLSSYFVSHAGNDLHDGSQETPFASIARVNDVDLQPGDAVFFEGGASFAGTLQIEDIDSGLVSAPVRIGSYGVGKATIDAGDLPGILAINAAGVEISNLNVVGTGQSPATYSGIEFRNTLPGDVKLEHVRITNVEVKGFGDYGIEIIGTADKSGFRDVRIEYVNIHHNTHGGISSTGLWDNTSTQYAHENIYVGHAEVWGNTGWAGSPNHSGSGIVLADIQNVTIERSEAYKNGEDNTHVGGPVGIWVWDVDQAMIRHNESHHNLTNSTADGGGFDFDGGVTNSVMEYNYSHHNAGAGYGIYQFGGARPFYNNHIRYNLSVDDGRRNSYGAFDFWNGNGGNGIRDTHVYNNMAYVSPSVEEVTTTTTNRKGQTTTTTSIVKLGDPRALRFISSTVDVTLRNNIFQTTGDVMLAQIDAKQTNLKMQGNNWWSSGGTFKVKVFAKTYTSFNAYVSGTGHEKVGTTVVGRSVDPKMESPTVVPTIGVANIDSLETRLNNFKLRSDSPLGFSQNAGLNLSIYTYSNSRDVAPFITEPARDFYGNLLPGDDGVYTIGAYDFV